VNTYRVQQKSMPMRFLSNYISI